MDYLFQDGGKPKKAKSKTTKSKTTKSKTSTKTKSSSKTGTKTKTSTKTGSKTTKSKTSTKKGGNFLGAVGELVAPSGWESFATTAGLFALDRADAALRRGKSTKNSAKKGGMRGGSKISGGHHLTLSNSLPNIKKHQENLYVSLQLHKPNTEDYLRIKKEINSLQKLINNKEIKNREASEQQSINLHKTFEELRNKNFVGDYLNYRLEYPNNPNALLDLEKGIRLKGYNEETIKKILNSAKEGIAYKGEISMHK